MYMMDMVERLAEIERKSDNFAKTASKYIYGDFLSLQERAETSEFCAVSDSYNYSQTLRTVCCESLCSLRPTLYGPFGTGDLGRRDLHDRVFHAIFGQDLERQLLRPDRRIRDGQRHLAHNILYLDLPQCRVANGVGVYLSPVLEYLMVTFYADVMSFLRLVKGVKFGLLFGFMVAYAAVYLLIFLRFIRFLKGEMTLSRYIVGLIPLAVVEHNKDVREEIHK